MVIHSRGEITSNDVRGGGGGTLGTFDSLPILAPASNLFSQVVHHALSLSLLYLIATDVKVA